MIRAGRRWAWLIPLAFLVLGMWFVPIAHTCQFSCVPGDLGDARFNGGILEHVYLWMIGAEPHLINAPFFYPMPGTLTFSDNHFGTAWIYALFRAAGADRYSAFDLWYVTGYVVNFVACYVVFRKLRFSVLGSAVGAFAFAFPMPVAAQAVHAQLTYRPFVPMGLLLWQRFQESGHWRWMGRLALVVVAQFFVSIYLGYFLGLFLAAWACAQWWVNRDGPRRWFQQWADWGSASARRELLRAGVAIAVALVALAWLMRPYLHYSHLYGFQRSATEIGGMLPRPQSYLLADLSQIWQGVSGRLIRDMPMRPEHQMFVGLGIVGLAAIALFRSTSRVRWVALLSLILLGALTLSVHGYSAYLLLTKVPGLGAVRAVTRIVMVLALPLAYLVALAIDALRENSWAWRVTGATLVILLVCESASVHPWTYNIAEAKARTAKLQAQLPALLPPHVMLFNPIGSETFYLAELDGIFVAQDMHRPTLNGYSGNIPPGYYPDASKSPCEQALARLDGASLFYADKLRRAMPSTAGEGVVIVGETAVCKRN